MKKLQSLFDELEAKIPDWNKQATSVSDSSVGWHIEHTALVAAKVISALQRSDPAYYKWKFNFVRSMVLLTNYIPRGKGKAPQAVLPAGDITLSSIQESVAKIKGRINVMNELQPKHYIEHPSFGHLDLCSAKKFLTIHTRHHLKIIDDIIKQKQSLR